MILSTLLYILLFIVFIALFLIIIPYNYILQFSYKDNLRYQIVVKTIIFSLVLEKKEGHEEKHFKIFGIKKELKDESEKIEKDNKKSKTKEDIKNKVKEKVKKEAKKRKFDFPQNIISSENIFHVFRFIRDILKMLIPKQFKLYFLLGLDDPYQSGLILAYFHTLKGIHPKLPVNIDIDWQKEVYEAEGKISGYISPGQLLFRLLIFIFSTKTLKIGWEIIKYKRNKNN